MCGIKPKHGTAQAHAQASFSVLRRRPTRALERERAAEQGGRGEIGRESGGGGSWTIIIIIIISAREKQTNANERVSQLSRDASEPRRLSSGAKPQIVSAAAASADSTRLDSTRIQIGPDSDLHWDRDWDCSLVWLWLWVWVWVLVAVVAEAEAGAR